MEARQRTGCSITDSIVILLKCSKPWSENELTGRVGVCRHWPGFRHKLTGLWCWPLLQLFQYINRFGILTTYIYVIFKLKINITEKRNSIFLSRKRNLVQCRINTMIPSTLLPSLLPPLYQSLPSYLLFIPFSLSPLPSDSLLLPPILSLFLSSSLTNLFD